MKKHQPGFVPVNFNLVGKILLVLGILLLFVKLFLGIGFIIVSLYLIFVVSKE